LIEPVKATEPRRAKLSISAEMMIELLERLADGYLALDDGGAITLTGLPRGGRVVGVRLEHWGDHVITLLLEGDGLPPAPEGALPAEIRPVFRRHVSRNGLDGD
jgi:hypothetical protein